MTVGPRLGVASARGFTAVNRHAKARPYHLETADVNHLLNCYPNASETVARTNYATVSKTSYCVIYGLHILGRGTVLVLLLVAVKQAEDEDDDTDDA